MSITQGGGGGVSPGPQYFPDWTVGKDYATGSYYTYTMPGLVISNQTIAGNGVMTLHPFICRNAHTFQTIGFYNSSAAQAGRKFRMGIYNSSNGFPSGAPLIDAGETTLGAAAGFNEKTVNQQLLAGKLYYLALNTDGALTGQSVMPTTGYLPNLTSGVSSFTSLVAVTSPYITYGYKMSSAYGALPTIGTLTEGVDTNNVPLLWLKG